MDQPTTDQSSTRGISGRFVVVVMLAFSVVVVAAMALYWEMYTRPFRPLQDAIAAEFPESGPRVIGGRHRSHEPGSPASLRIIIQVDFDPNADEFRSMETAQRLARLAAERVDLTEYDELNVHLEQRVAEKELRQWSLTRPIEDGNVEIATSPPEVD